MIADDVHAEVREVVAKKFNLHPNHIIVVGSSKLGYSLSPEKAFKPFDSESDLDVALVDGSLFDRYWEEIHKLKATTIPWPEFGQFRGYHFDGWMRPDKLPLANIRNEWFDFFTSLQSKRIGGGLPLRAGLYKSWHFLEAYQAKGVKLCFQSEVNYENDSNK